MARRILAANDSLVRIPKNHRKKVFSAERLVDFIDDPSEIMRKIVERVPEVRGEDDKDTEKMLLKGL